MSAKPTSVELEQQIAAMQKEIAELNALVRSLVEEPEAAGEPGRMKTAKAMADSAVTEAHEIADRVTDFVEKRPMQGDREEGQTSAVQAGSGSPDTGGPERRAFRAGPPAWSKLHCP